MNRRILVRTPVKLLWLPRTCGWSESRGSGFHDSFVGGLTIRVSLLMSHPRMSHYSARRGSWRGSRRGNFLSIPRSSRTGTQSCLVSAQSSHEPLRRVGCWGQDSVGTRGWWRHRCCQSCSWRPLSIHSSSLRGLLDNSTRHSSRVQRQEPRPGRSQSGVPIPRRASEPGKARGSAGNQRSCSSHDRYETDGS